MAALQPPSRQTGSDPVKSDRSSPNLQDVVSGIGDVFMSGGGGSAPPIDLSLFRSLITPENALKLFQYQTDIKLFLNSIGSHDAYTSKEPDFIRVIKNTFEANKKKRIF